MASFFDALLSPEQLEAAIARREAAAKAAAERVEAGIKDPPPETPPEPPYIHEKWMPATLDKSDIEIIAISSGCAGFQTINSSWADGTIREVWGLDQKPMQVNIGDVLVLQGGVLSVLSKSDAEDKITR